MHFRLPTAYCAHCKSLQQVMQTPDAKCIGGKRRCKIAIPLSSDAFLCAWRRPGAVREHGGAEPPRRRVADRRAVRQGRLRLRPEEGGRPARGGRRAPRARVRRGDAAVCTSWWDKGPSHPAGEHEYIDAVVAVEPGPGAATATRLVVEVDFRSEFEVARPTKAYRAALQALPPLFVGTPDRLGRVVALVADAARQSLRKRGLHFPPWRKPEYMRAKWLSPHARAGAPDKPPAPPAQASSLAAPVSAASFAGEFELRFDEKPKAPDGTAGEEKKITAVVSPSPSPWRPEEPEASKQSPPAPAPQAKGKVVTGLASVL